MNHETPNGPFIFFYRIIRGERPSLQDFLSNQAKGKIPRDSTPEVLRRWDGLSMYDTVCQARLTARMFPRLGRHVAAVSVPIGGRIRFERTGDRERGHFTVWGDPEDLLALVISVTPAELLH